MTEPGERNELRARLRRVEDDAAAARFLAGGADRDAGEVRTELREFRIQSTRLLNAVREDFVDQRERMDRGFGRVDEQFAQVAEEFSRVDQNFLTVRGQLDGVAAFVQLIADKLPDGDGDERPPG